MAELRSRREGPRGIGRAAAARLGEGAQVAVSSVHPGSSKRAVAALEPLGRVFRIGHHGDLNELMCLGALSAAEMAMRDEGISLEPGSGVAAAQEFYRENPAR